MKDLNSKKSLVITLLLLELVAVAFNMILPFQITFNHVAVDVVKPKGNTRLLKVRHLNAYQIIPVIIYTLLESLQNKVWSTILNIMNAIKAIYFVTRYCYATRSLPFTTMHGVCVEYSIKYETYLSKCQGEAELVFMYNACYTYQKRNCIATKFITVSTWTTRHKRSSTKQKSNHHAE
jgi:hypothetical protein